MILACAKRIVVKEIELEKKTPGGLIIPNKEEQVLAEVISAGSEVDVNVTAGVFVILQPNTGIQIEIDDEIYLSINENQVLGIIVDTE